MLHHKFLSQQILNQRIQHHQHVTANDIQRIVRRDYMWNAQEVKTLLARINEPEKFRVQAAILKLSGGTLKDVASYVELAELDPWSILFFAEFPNFFHIENNTCEKRERAITNDWFSYITWLNRV